MPIARKEHRCTLCGEIIPAKSEYVNERITPWDHPDNERFFTFKAHSECNAVWQRVGDRHEWVFPDDHYEWRKELAEHRQPTAEPATNAGEVA